MEKNICKEGHLFTLLLRITVEELSECPRTEHKDCKDFTVWGVGWQGEGCLIGKQSPIEQKFHFKASVFELSGGDYPISFWKIAFGLRNLFWPAIILDERDLVDTVCEMILRSLEKTSSSNGIPTITIHPLSFDYSGAQKLYAIVPPDGQRRKVRVLSDR
ncbi:MAG: hypothetical protein ACYC75_02510 [Minisyncoccota bacterium]